MKIKNLDMLRNHAIESLENLSSGKITIEEAGATSKLCENVISTLKLQIEFAKLVGREPNISFIGDHTKWKVIPKKILIEDKK